MRFGRFVALAVLLPGTAAWSAVEYRAKLKPPEALRPFLDHVEPGRDAFPEEREAAELQARLDELVRRRAPGLRGAPGQARRNTWDSR